MLKKGAALHDQRQPFLNPPTPSGQNTFTPVTLQPVTASGNQRTAFIGCWDPNAESTAPATTQGGITSTFQSRPVHQPNPSDPSQRSHFTTPRAGPPPSYSPSTASSSAAPFNYGDPPGRSSSGAGHFAVRNLSIRDQQQSTPPTRQSPRPVPPGAIEAAPPEAENTTGDTTTEDNLDEVNTHTQGTEFYGPTGAFSFLQRLRSRARSVADAGSQSEKPKRSSVVNLLHSSDWITASLALSPPEKGASPGRVSDRSPQAEPDHGPSPKEALAAALLHCASPMSTISSGDGSRAGTQDGSQKASHKSEYGIERECAQLFFRNLHLIHPVLDEPTFIARCEKEFWSSEADGHSLGRQGSFYALFNTVLALGAIVAGDDAGFMRGYDPRKLDRKMLEMTSDTVYPPVRLSQAFFDRAKIHIGDIFEACSVESATALFFMAVFAQNALKPHSCYLYSGMAVRTALAIGLPNSTTQPNDPRAILWWNIYTFEVEMCASVGRGSALNKPDSYPIPQPKAHNLQDQRAITAPMIELSQLVTAVFHEIHTNKDSDKPTASRSVTAMDFDRRLLEWKTGLPPIYNFDKSSLTEPEWSTKQKNVLKIRFLNTRILLHRPFLVAASSRPGSPHYTEHVDLCVDAARETVALLYAAYLNRPYFRTWWYNTTYVLYATMILLFAILCNLRPDLDQMLLSDAEKSLEILRVMSPVAVARACTEIIQEIYDSAEKTIRERHENAVASGPDSTHRGMAAAPSMTAMGSDASNYNAPAMSNILNPLSMGEQGAYTGLINMNLMGDITDYANVFGGTGETQWSLQPEDIHIPWGFDRSGDSDGLNPDGSNAGHATGWS